MKGIILAGGKNLRLYPLTKVISKQLLPVYDKPMIYYPLSILMMAKIREILIISTPEDLPVYQRLLKDGLQLGIRIEYKVQENPEGLAQAFILAEEFIDGDDVCLILGDNLFFGDNLKDIIKKAISENRGATVFGKRVVEPEKFGVIEFDDNNQILSITEKPEEPVSDVAVLGLYFYNNQVVEYAKKLIPSSRKELEISDLNNQYIEDGLLDFMLVEEVEWFDTGTIESLFEAADFVRKIEETEARKISVIEEIAFDNGWIDKNQLIESALQSEKSDYGKYLKELADKL